mmetsp:Transcript_33755/g.104874  ORF Transcript_33755/g.104874 Transcript_33755/m.104874 type:complete len:205 (-) Transcript_33755:251-865(-)
MLPGALVQELLDCQQDRAHLPHHTVAGDGVLLALEEVAGAEGDPRERLAGVHGDLRRRDAQAAHVHRLAPGDECFAKALEVAVVGGLVDGLDQVLDLLGQPFLVDAAKRPVQELIELNLPVLVRVRHPQDLLYVIVRPHRSVQVLQDQRELPPVYDAVAVLVERLELIHDLMSDLRLLGLVFFRLVQQRTDGILDHLPVNDCVG